MAEHFVHYDMFDLGDALGLHRAPFIILEAIFLHSACLKVWTHYEVDYAKICTLNEKTLASPGSVCLFALYGMAIWALSFSYLVLKVNLIPFIPVMYMPIGLYFLFLAHLVIPSRCCLRSTRMWAVRELSIWCVSPFVKPKFINFFFSDYLVSLNQVFIDVVFISFYYAAKGTLTPPHPSMFWWMRAIALCVPEYMRFFQCIQFYQKTNDDRQLVCGMKYLSITAVAVSKELLHYFQEKQEDYFVNPYFTAWFSCVLARSCFISYWDVAADFGLFEKDFYGRPRVVREVILYPIPVYYFTIIENTLARFFWVAHILAHKTGLINKLALDLIGPTVELIRRTVWSIVIIEKKHVDVMMNLKTMQDIDIEGPEHQKSEKLSLMQSEFRRKYVAKTGRTIPMINRNSYFRREAVMNPQTAFYRKNPAVAAPRARSITEQFGTGARSITEQFGTGASSYRASRSRRSSSIDYFPPKPRKPSTRYSYPQSIVAEPSDRDDAKQANLMLIDLSHSEDDDEQPLLGDKNQGWSPSPVMNPLWIQESDTEES